MMEWLDSFMRKKKKRKIPSDNGAKKQENGCKIK